jgi:hypothetical protein
MKYTLDETYLIKVESSQSSKAEIPPMYENNSLRISGEENMVYEIRSLWDRGLVTKVFQLGRSSHELTDVRLKKILTKYPKKG